MSVKTFLEGDERLCSFYSIYFLNLIMQNILKVSGIPTMDLDEDVIITSGIVNLYNFWYVPEFFHYLIV